MAFAITAIDISAIAEDSNSNMGLVYMYKAYNKIDVCLFIEICIKSVFNPELYNFNLDH